MHEHGQAPIFNIPYSHSLLSSIILSVIAGGFGYFTIGRTKRVFWIIFSLTLSHWVLDWVVHRPDLPLYPGGVGYGLGLWDYPVFSYSLEMSLVLAGTLFWVSKTRAQSGLYKVLPWVLFCLMAVFQYTFIFTPPENPTPIMLGGLAGVTYIGLAGLIAWAESGRSWI